MIRWPRLRARLALFALAATLGLNAGLISTPAFAQEQPPMPGEEEKSEGRPLDGYLLTGCLVGAAMFVVGKTARRS